MGDALLRLLLIGGVLAAAAGIAYLSRRRFAVRPKLGRDGVEFAPGLVVFTSTECRRCKVVLAAAKSTGAPLREVTYEIEASLQEKLGVTGVPLTLVVDGAGQPAAQFAGLVRSRTLSRALHRAGL